MFLLMEKQEMNTYEHIGNELFYSGIYHIYGDMFYFNLKVWVLSLIVLFLTPLATNSNSPLFDSAWLLNQTSFFL